MGRLSDRDLRRFVVDGYLVLSDVVPEALLAAADVTGGRGDLVLAHFLLGHNKGGNLAPWDRRTIYYRLAVPGHAERWEETFLDAWTEYPAVRPARRERLGRATLKGWETGDLPAGC